MPPFHLTSDHEDVLFVFVFGGLSQCLKAHQHLDVALDSQVAREVGLQGGQGALKDGHQVLLADNHCYIWSYLRQVTLHHLTHTWGWRGVIMLYVYHSRIVVGLVYGIKSM